MKTIAALADSGYLEFARMEPDGLTGKRVAAARREVNLSQRALAAELGVSVRTMQNYEAGKFVPYRHLDALSRLLGCSSSWLLYGHEQPDTDRLLARVREQRNRLHQNLERLHELGEQLLDNVARSVEMNDPLRDEHQSAARASRLLR